jgi:hypothetical protein
MTKFLLSTLVIVFACFSQQKIITDSSITTLCWAGSTDTASVYLVYYRNYTGDTTWNFMGSTKLTEYSCTKTNKKNVVFGIKTVVYDDTSNMHSSLDALACISGTCTSCASGAWYLNWKIKAPTKLMKK